VFNLVGEGFGGAVIGVSMCKKEKITVVEVWVKDKGECPQVFASLVSKVGVGAG
jgi:hypothetical protein